MFEILARYLARLAIIYIRQSTEKQVRNNPGSRLYQEGQILHARQHGWPDDRIRIVDDDLGQSGRTTKRRGYQGLLSLIQSESVGALFISELGRAGRNEIGWFELLELLAAKDILLFIDGRVTDPHDPNAVFAKKIEALTIARENSIRTETVHRGRLGNARAGLAVSAPPLGYVQEYGSRDATIVKTGKWLKDVHTQDSIDTVFRVFREQRTLPRTVRKLLRLKAQVPSSHGAWVNPTVQNVRRFITHPAYCGTYLYGRKHWKRVLNGGEPLPAHRLLGQYVRFDDHHEPYISREEYEHNQQTLRINRHVPWRSSLGPGRALLSGCCRCVQHASMSVSYSGRGIPTRWDYRCPGTFIKGGRACVSVPGPLVDAHAVEAVLTALSGSVVDEVKGIWREKRREWVRTHGGIGNQIAQYELRLQRVERRLLEPRDDQPHVRALYEREYDNISREIARLKERASTEVQAPDPFTEDKWNELAQLCSDIRQIWSAPTSEIQDKKQILRILLDRVVIDTVDAERVTFRLIWADGRPDTALEALRTPYFHRIIWEDFQANKSVEAIVERLAALGARTLQGNPWCRATVLRTLWQLKHRDGKITRAGRRRQALKMGR